MTPENFTNFFCKNVKKIRRGTGLTQKEFAVEIGSNLKMVDAVECGRTLSLPTVYKVSRRYNYSMDDLMTKLI